MRALARRADVGDIDGWFRRILRQLTALLAAAWRAIRDLTGMYLEDHAAAEGRTVEPTLAEWNTEQVLTNLRVTGPIAFKTAIGAGHDEQEALDSMTSQLVGASEKIVLRGDRDTVMATVDDRDDIVGWRRVSDGDPCAWCAMLVSRGAVYKSGRTAGDQRFLGNEYHDGDRCTAEPLYVHEEEPAEVQALYALWQKVTAGKSGADALRAWREFWDNRERPSAPRSEPIPAPPVDDRQQRARDRQAAIDVQRGRAEMLAELEEIAVINQADGDELARMARVAAERFGVADDPELAALLRRAGEGDAAMVEATLRAVAERLGLTRIGGDLDAEQVVKFDRARHTLPPGEKATPFVEIARPGYLAVIDGELKVIVKARVVSTDERPAARPAQPVSPWHLTLDGIEDLAAIVADVDDSIPRRRLSGGMSAEVELIELPGGRLIVHKRGLDWGDPEEVAESVRTQSDAEQLAPVLARVLGASVARVYRTEPDAVWMEFIEGDFDHDALLDSDDAVRLGLLDILSANGDRNSGNYLRRNDGLVGIDHGFNWGAHFIDVDQLIRGRSEQPVKHFADDFGLRDNPLMPQDINVLRERLEALRPDFAHLGREDWLEYSLRVLERLRAHAKGTEPLYG